MSYVICLTRAQQSRNMGASYNGSPGLKYLFAYGTPKYFLAVSRNFSLSLFLTAGSFLSTVDYSVTYLRYLICSTFYFLNLSKFARKSF